MSLEHCYNPQQLKILGINSKDLDFEPVLPHLRLLVEVGGRVLGAGIGFYVGNLFKDQREYISWISLSMLAGYVLFNTATHDLTNKLWRTKEYNPWYRRLNQW